MDDVMLMDTAISAAREAHQPVAPNPRVGAAILTVDGATFVGATEPPGGRHAERVALDAAGASARGATIAVTLEPCAHQGRTGPCADALIHAGIARVVVATEDPDPNVSGRGIERLRAAGVDVTVGLKREVVEDDLRAYLHHRRTGRPYVVLKLAASIDGRTAAPDGSSQWITGELARKDAHRLRAESQAILVGAGTVRADNPSLTVRHVEGVDPIRIVLGHAPQGANVHPCWERSGELGAILDELGANGVLQLLVEGGASVAQSFHEQRLVERYVVYLAPMLFGGDDALGLFRGAGASTLSDAWRGQIAGIERLGDDIRIDLVPSHQ